MHPGEPDAAIQGNQVLSQRSREIRAYKMQMAFRLQTPGPVARGKLCAVKAARWIHVTLRFEWVCRPFSLL